MSTTYCFALLPPSVAHDLERLIETKSALMRAIGFEAIEGYGRASAIHRRHGLFLHVIYLNAEACEALALAAREQELVHQFTLNDAEAIGLRLCARLGGQASWRNELQLLTYKVERARRAGKIEQETSLRAEIRRMKILRAGDVARDERQALRPTLH